MTLDEDLDQLEVAIRKLQIEWDKFFGGIEKKPPNEMKGRVESLIRRHAYGEIRNNTERFRYQNLTARYNTFSELWNKRLRAMEEGRPMGVHGLRAQALPPPPPPVPERPAGRPTPARSSSGEVRVSDGQRDSEAVRELFERFVTARQEAGEAAPVKFESFQKLIVQQASRIVSEKGAQAVDFRLETKDGKVSLKARPVKE